MGTSKKSKSLHLSVVWAIDDLLNNAMLHSLTKEISLLRNRSGHISVRLDS